MKKDQVLLVEGPDDQHVMWALCQKFKVPHTFDVEKTDGIDKLLKGIPVRLKTNVKALGVIIDADLNLSQRFDQLRAKFAEAEIQLPVQPEAGGFVGQFEDKRIGVWIMPNNQTPGILEDFIRFLVPSGDVLEPETELALTRLEDAQLNRYKAADRSKAFIHTWLAWQQAPGTPLGLAITKRYLDPDAAECQVFIDWLNRLFNP